MPGDRTNRYENSGKDFDTDLPSSRGDFRHEPDDAADRFDAQEERFPSFSPNTTREQLFVQWPALIEDGDL